MGLIKQFGLDPVLLGAQIINFLIVLFLLRRFLYKPVLELLKKRQDAIEGGLKKSEEAERRFAKVLVLEKTILKNAQMQAKRIVEDAKTQSSDLAVQIEENIKIRSEKMLNDAKGQINREAKETEKRLTLNISRIAIAFLEKSVSQLFSKSDQNAIMDRAMGKIKNAS